MALDLHTLAQPKFLIIGGVAVVGGLFLAQRLKSGAKPAEEAAPGVIERPVEAPSDIQAQDEASRQLTALQDKLAQQVADAQQKYNELQQKQEEQAQEYQGRLNLQGQQYGTQLAGLQAVIDRLNAQISALQNAPKPVVAQPQPQPGGDSGRPGVITQPVLSPVGTTTPTPVAPRPDIGIQPPVGRVITPGVQHFPGLADNYQMNCGGFRQGLLYPSFEVARRDQESKGQNSTFNERNLASIAIQGATTPWRYGWDQANNPLGQALINQSRVAWGLRPLNQGEMYEMRDHMKQLWGANGFNERDSVFQSHEYSRQLWERWNRPYQCPTSSIRR